MPSELTFTREAPRAKCQAAATAQQMILHMSQARRPNAEGILMWSDKVTDSGRRRLNATAVR